MSVLEISIPKDAVIMRLDKYIQKALPGLPSWAVREAFSHKDVKMDGRRVKAEDMINPGAMIQLYGVEEEAGLKLNVVYEDEQVLLVNKPAGISVQTDDGGGRTMEDLALHHVRKDNENTYPPKACHRLDNQTSGLLLFAKTEQAHAILTAAFKERSMKKTYVCLVKGVPQPETAVLHAYLVKDEKAARVKVFDFPAPGTMPITTGYRVLEKGNVSRLEVDLITGRTHQIRAHLSHIGHPVLGDDAYGDRAFNREQSTKRLMLCAASITLSARDELSYLNGRTFTILPPF